MKITLALLIGLLLVTGCHICYVSPAKSHIANIRTCKTTVQFATPSRSQWYSLVIGLPLRDKKPYLKELPNLSGTITIFSGKTVLTTIRLNRDNFHWDDSLLKSHKLEGVVITSGRSLSVLKPGQTYKLKLTLGDKSLLPFSLWLNYLST